MKMKFTFVLLFIFLSVLLVGCNNVDEELTNQVNDLDSQVSDLEAELLSLDQLLSLVEEKLESLNSNFDIHDDTLITYRNRILALEAEKSVLQDKIRQLETELSSMDSKYAKEIKVFLADEYHLAPDDNFQLFYRSVIQAVNPYIYHIKLTGLVGHGYNRYYEWKPTAADVGTTQTLKLEVRDENGRLLGSDTTKLIVSSAYSHGPKTVLAMGASITANGVWVQQGASRYQAAGGGVINLIGTVTAGGVKHEGRGGWQWKSFVSGYDATTPSPFKANSGSGISFIDYCLRNNFPPIDELYIIMTYNGVGGSFRTFDMSSEPFLSAKIFIDQFHKDFPNGKVTLMSVPLPSVHAGLGDYYTINQSFGDNYGQFVTILNYNKQLEDFAKMPEYKTFMRYVDAAAQFDVEYNMPTVSKNVNNQNTTKEQIGSSMGMHPTNNGYKQIGDAFYRALCKPW